MGLGTPELLIVLAVVVLVFGGKKLPELARSLGHAKNEFEDATKGRPSSDQEADPTTVV